MCDLTNEKPPERNIFVLIKNLTDLIMLMMYQIS